MEGGILQLAVKGREDVHLTSEPEFSYYETVYKKHTIFSIQNNIYNIVGKRFGQEIEFKIPKGGDLLSNINLEVYLPELEETVKVKNVVENIIDYDIKINNLKYFLVKVINGESENLFYLIPEFILENISGIKLDTLEKYKLNDSNFSFLIKNVDEFYVIDLLKNTLINLLNLNTDLNEKNLIINLKNNKIAFNDFLTTNKIYEKYEKVLKNIIFDNYDFYYSDVLNNLGNVSLSDFNELSNYYYEIDGKNIHTLNNIENYEDLKDVYGSYFDFINFLYQNHKNYKLIINYFIDINFSNINPSRLGNIINSTDLTVPFENLTSDYKTNYEVHVHYEREYFKNRTIIEQIYDNIKIFNKNTFYLNTLAISSYLINKNTAPLLVVTDSYYPNKIEIEVNYLNDDFIRIKKYSSNKSLYDEIITTNQNANNSLETISKNANILSNYVLFLLELIELFETNGFTKDIQCFNNYSKDFIDDLSNNIVKNIDYNYLLNNINNLPQYLIIKIKEIGPLIFLKNKVLTLLFNLINIGEKNLVVNEEQVNFNAYLYLELKNILCLETLNNSFNELLINNNLVIYSEDNYESYVNLINKNVNNPNQFLKVRIENELIVDNNNFGNLDLIDINGFYIVEFNIKPLIYADYYYNNKLLEYFKKEGKYFLRLEDNRAQYIIKQVYKRDVPYIELDYDLSNNDLKKLEISNYEKLLNCKNNVYLIFDSNLDLIENNKILLNLEKDIYFIDVSNNVEFLNKKKSYDYNNKVYILKQTRNGDVNYKKVKLLGIDDGLVIDELIIDKYYYSKIELIVLDGYYLDVDFTLDKKILFKEIANKILENYDIDDLNYLNNIHFGIDLALSIESINISDLYKLIDYEFLNMSNSLKLINLKNDEYYIYGTIDNVKGYYYPVYLTEIEARLNDRNRLALEKVVNEYNIKFYVSKNNFNYSEELNEDIKKYKFLEIIENSLNVKLNRTTFIGDLNILEDLEIEILNEKGVKYNKLRLYHNRKLPNLLNLTSSSISQYSKDIVYDYFIHQPAIIRLKNSNNYVITNMSLNTNDVFINDKKVVNLCKIDSNQLMRNNFTKISFNFDDDILLESKDEINNIYNNLLNSKYSFLLNINNVTELIINNEKEGLENLKNSSLLIKSVVDKFSDRYINTSDVLVKYYRDNNIQTFYNIYGSDISGVVQYFTTLEIENKFLGLPWMRLNINVELNEDIINIRNFMIENVNFLIENEDLLNKYNSSNRELEFIENYQKNILDDNNLMEVELYNKLELNVSFLKNIIYNNKKLEFNVNLENNKLLLNSEDINETDFYLYSRNNEIEDYDIKYITIKDNKIANLVISDQLFSVIIDDANNFRLLDNLNDIKIFNPRVFNINIEYLILDNNNYYKKIRFVCILENIDNLLENVYLIKSLGVLVILKNYIYIISSYELEKNDNIIKKLIVKKINNVNDVIINLENLSNIYNNETNIEEILELSVKVIENYKFYDILNDDTILEDNFVYYENGSLESISLEKLIIFNKENTLLDKVIIIEKSKINLLSIFDNSLNNINLLESNDYFSDKYIFDSSINELLNLEDKNYMVYSLDYEDFYLDLSINIILDNSFNYLEILNDNKSLIGGYIYFNNIYWKLKVIENSKLVSFKYSLVNPLNNNNLFDNFRIRLPINNDSIYRYKLNNEIQFKKSYDNFSWNFIDGLNLNINTDSIKFNNYLLTKENNYFKFSDNISSRTKLIDTSNNIERVLSLLNNQEDFDFIMYSGLENNLVISSSYVYLDNSNIIVKIFVNNNKEIINAYTNNYLFNLSIDNLYYITINFDYDNLTNELNEGIIFILKEDGILNQINLVVYKNQIYNRLKIDVNNQKIIEPLNLNSLDILNLVDISVNNLKFDENLFEINTLNSLKIKTFVENIDIYYNLDGLTDLGIDDYKICNLLTYNLEFIGFLEDVNEIIDENIILKNNNNFVVGNDNIFKNKFVEIEKYRVEKSIKLDCSGYIDKYGYLHINDEDINLVDNLIIKINGNYYIVLKSWGNIVNVKIADNKIINQITYPYYFESIIILGRFKNNVYNYVNYLLKEERNNLFKSIENTSILNKGDYFIKDNSLNVYSNQNIDNCFSLSGNFINLKTYKNMIFIENSFILDLKILDVIYDVSNNYKEYKIERILDNILLVDDNFTDSILEKILYVPILNYKLARDNSDKYLVINEDKYGLKKLIKIDFEFKVDLCVNWYYSDPNRYSNKVKFNKITEKIYKIDNNLDLSKINMYYNQVLGVCIDFKIIDYVRILDFDLSNGLVEIDIDIDLDIDLDTLLFVFNSDELLRDNILVSINKDNNVNYKIDFEIIPYYVNKYEIVNLILFYVINNNSYSTNFLINLYEENGKYKFRSEELSIYLNSYILDNIDILYVLDGLNLISVEKESLDIFSIKIMNINPKNLVLITELYDNNKFLTLVKLDNNKIVSNLKIHSYRSKFLVNNFYEIKIKMDNNIEFNGSDIKLVKKYREINDNYQFVYELNIIHKEPIFNPNLNKFIIEIEFLQDYEELTLDALLLYKTYSDIELSRILKLIKLNNKVYIETDILLNYNKIYLVQNNQLKITQNFDFLDNIYENNLINNSIYLHQFINLRWYGIRRNYLVEDTNLNLLNKIVDINKPFNSVLKIYEDNLNIILETKNQLLNIPNNTGISTLIDIYQNVVINDIEILDYSTINNFSFINIDLNLLYKLSRDNKKLLDNISLFKTTKNVKFIYTDVVSIVNDSSSVFLEDDIFYYDVIISLDVINGLAYELRQMTDIILNLIEENNNFGFWVVWKDIIEYKINKFGYTIKENCLHKLDEELNLTYFIKTDNGYIRKNPITYDVDISYNNISNSYELRRDVNKFSSFIESIILNNNNRFGINIDLLLNNIDYVLKNNVDINYVYKNEIKSINQLYIEYLWNKYKFNPIYENINPDILVDDRLYKYEIELGILDEDRLDSTDIIIYNENEINNAIILSKKATFYENEINTELLTLSQNVRYKINESNYLGNFYRIDVNNNIINDNLEIKFGEDYINLIEINDKTIYIALDSEIDNLDHFEYVNNIYVKNGNLLVIDYNKSFELIKLYIREGDNIYFIPNNYQDTKIYFYCKQFGINLGLNYNLDVSKNIIDYHEKINVQIINNHFVFDISINNFEMGKIYLFDQSHISNLNYPLRIAEDLSFNDYYTNSYGLAGDNKVIYFAPIKLGKVYFYTENRNLENVLNDPYNFGIYYNGTNIIDGSSNIVEVDVSVNSVPAYELSNTIYETGKIYKFNILNFNIDNFGITLNLFYLFSENNGNVYIPIVLDDKIINVTSNVIIKKDFIYKVIEIKKIIKLINFDKKVYLIKSDEIIRNKDYISSNIEDNIYVENMNGEIIKPFRVIMKSYAEFIVVLDNNEDLKNIVHYSNLNQSFPVNLNNLELENKIYYDIYVNDNLINNSSQIILKLNNNINNYINGIVNNGQFIINSDRSLILDNLMIINNIYKVEYNTDVSFIYIKIPKNLILTFVSDYDLRYLIVDNSNNIIDYSNELIVDSSNIVNNQFKINKTDINYVEDMDIYINQYIKYTDLNKLFELADYFNEIKLEPKLEIDYQNYLFEIRNNDFYDYIYGIELVEELTDFNYYTDKIFLTYNSNKITNLDFIYFDQYNKKQLILGSNKNIYNIYKLLIGDNYYDINIIINVKKQFRGKVVDDKILISSDIFNINSNFLSLYYKIKLSGYNDIIIRNKFIDNNIIITKNVEIIETIEEKINKISYVEDVVFKLFKYIKFYINDELIEELTPDIYKVIYNLHYEEKHKNNIMKLRKDGNNYKFSLPLEFWFNHNHLNLPLIAMNNTDLFIKFRIEDLNKLANFNSLNLNNTNIKIMVDIDNILLDDYERLLFGSKGHEYIIERYVDYKSYRLNQLQSVNRIPIKGIIKNIYWFGYNYINDDLFIRNEVIENEEKYQEYLDLMKRYNLYLENKLPFELDFTIISKNKKLLIIGGNLVNYIKNNKFLNQFDIEFVLFLYEKYIYPKNNLKSIISRLNLYFTHLYYSRTILKKDPIMKEINIKINGTTLFGKRDNMYYNNVLPNKNLTTIPDDHYYFTSFALHPEEHQPSGHLNFNKLDEFVIISNNDERVVNQAYQLKVMVKEYQILRVIGGMASLMW